MELSFTNSAFTRGSFIVHRVDTTTSTQDDLRGLTDAAHLTTVRAEHQTVGRGRLGRAWESKPGQSLLASTFVALPDTERMRERLGFLTLIGAAAARAALAELTASDAFTVKFPNDVMCDGGKIAGVLGEFLPEHSTARGELCAAIGVGINVSQGPDELVDGATSLAAQGFAGQDDARQDDARQDDAGQTDSGQTDSGQDDARQDDARQDDSGQTDSGQDDAGQDDAGPKNSGPKNSGQTDSEQTDYGRNDAGQDDAGRNGAGQPSADRLLELYLHHLSRRIDAFANGADATELIAELNEHLDGRGTHATVAGESGIIVGLTDSAHLILRGEQEAQVSPADVAMFVEHGLTQRPSSDSSKDANL